MGLPKSIQFPLIMAGLLSPLLSSFTVPLPLSALPQQWEVSLSFPETSDRGAPARTAGGATRGVQCVQSTQTPLTVLMPANNVGTTVSPNPTVFWYLPETEADSAEFTLFDESRNQVYQTTFAIGDRSGIVKFALPTTLENGQETLETGKEYVWELALICNPENRNEDVFVSGLLLRTQISSTLKNQIDNSVPLEQAKLYSEAKIWSETVTTLAELHHTFPQEWETLLESVGLETLVEAPFVDCCSAKKMNESEENELLLDDDSSQLEENELSPEYDSSGSQENELSPEYDSSGSQETELLPDYDLSN
ncbi:MAG: DUF928 domain-containing protein [Oscillatoria sp. PMC 1068.18]|nr:DUF928 domain-containing protein [Oscillatoria sp. PMC 1076.18]MEC4988811.1 DUF928 domain-containing protein [Oscillatoria sp. PMC 1068.18]